MRVPWWYARLRTNKRGEPFTPHSKNHFYFYSLSTSLYSSQLLLLHHLPLQIREAPHRSSAPQWNAQMQNGAQYNNRRSTAPPHGTDNYGSAPPAPAYDPSPYAQPRYEEPPHPHHPQYAHNTTQPHYAQPSNGAPRYDEVDPLAPTRFSSTRQANPTYDPLAPTQYNSPQYTTPSPPHNNGPVACSPLEGGNVPIAAPTHSDPTLRNPDGTYNDPPPKNAAPLPPTAEAPMREEEHPSEGDNESPETPLDTMQGVEARGAGFEATRVRDVTPPRDGGGEVIWDGGFPVAGLEHIPLQERVELLANCPPEVLMRLFPKVDEEVVKMVMEQGRDLVCIDVCV